MPYRVKWEKTIPFVENIYLWNEGFSIQGIFLFFQFTSGFAFRFPVHVYMLKNMLNKTRCRSRYERQNNKEVSWLISIRKI